MLLLNETVRHESKTHAGVAFTVRVLSVIERMKRDAGVAESRERIQALSEEKGEADKPHERAAIDELDRILTTVYVPHYIKFGLVNLEGVGSADGETATTELLLKCAPTDLLMEIYFACRDAGGIDAETEKNSQRSGTSPAPEAGPTNPISAEDANETAGTHSETAGSISLVA